MNTKKYNQNILFKQQLIHYGPLFHKALQYRGELDIFVNEKKYKFTGELQEQLLNFIMFCKTKKILFNKGKIDTLTKEQGIFINNFYKSSLLKNEGISFEQFINFDFSVYLEYKYVKNDQYYQIEEYIKNGEKCQIDGQLYSISNLRIPFGIYNGKPGSKLSGLYRKEITPKDVTINSSNPIIIRQYNEKWKQQLNDQNAQFLASWYDDVSNKIIYMRPERANNTIFENNESKFNFAREIGENIDLILKELFKMKESKKLMDQQLFCCIYIIYLFGIRNGSHDLDNGVIGASQLKKENMKLNEERNEKKENIYILRLKFKGKDFVDYDQQRVISFDIYKVYKYIYDLKQKDEELFDFSYNKVNETLDSIYKGLTAKVFRTYRASQIIDIIIQNIKRNYSNLSDKEKQVKQQELLLLLNNGLLKVAEFCNHVKKSNLNEKEIEKKKKDIKEQIDKLYEKIEKEERNSSPNKEKVIVIQQKIKQLLLKLEQLDKQSQLSIGTSKQNYIDPRILVSYCKFFNIPIEKVYSKTEIKQIQWCIEKTDKNYKFHKY